MKHSKVLLSAVALGLAASAPVKADDHPWNDEVGKWFVAPFVGMTFVDDELTTGRTALEVIAAVQARHPRPRYVIAALVDWLVWDTLPDRWFIPGALLVVLAGASMLRCEPTEPL